MRDVQRGTAARRLALVAAALLATTAVLAIAQSDPLSKALDSTQQAQRASSDSQKRVDQLDDQTRALLERYRAATWQAQQLTAYAQQLDSLLEQQATELASIKQQLAELDRAGEDLLPLMLRMTDSLDQFIALDLPFLQNERRERVATVKRALSDPQITTGDKFRRILEAYQIEIDYGRNFGVERDTVGGIEMDVLRVGRVALYALAPDGSEARVWNLNAQQWQPLPRSVRQTVRDGIKMARELGPSNVLELPVPAAAAAKVTP